MSFSTMLREQKALDSSKDLKKAMKKKGWLDGGVEFQSQEWLKKFEKL